MLTRNAYVYRETLDTQRKVLFHYWGSIDNAIEFNDKLRAKSEIRPYQEMPLRKPKPIQHKNKKYSWTKTSMDQNESKRFPQKLNRNWWKRKSEQEEELSDSEDEHYRFKLPAPKSLKF